MVYFQLVQTVYWLALATWYGGTVFALVAAPLIFRTVREANPILPHVLSVNLENQHGALLGGEIVGGVLRTLSYVFLCCAAIVLTMLICQWFVMDPSVRNKTDGIIRCILFVVVAAVLMRDRWLVWPRAWRYRQEYIDHADEPDVANPAKDRFDEYQREMFRMYVVEVVVLSLMIVFSTGITPTVTLGGR